MRVWVNLISNITVAMGESVFKFNRTVVMGFLIHHFLQFLAFLHLSDLYHHGSASLEAGRPERYFLLHR